MHEQGAVGGLRDRVVVAIESGMSCRQAALRLGASASSAIRWRTLARRKGDVRPGPLGGDRRSGRVEAHAPLILGLLHKKRDATLQELRDGLAEHGVAVSMGTLWRFSIVGRSRSKKVGARGRTELPRRPVPTPGLVRRTVRPR